MGYSIRRLLAEYRAAIFDLDGVLADSMGLWQNLCRDWLGARGLVPPETLEEDIAPMTLSESAAWVIRRYGLALSPARVMREWEDRVLYHYAHTVAPKDGAEELTGLLAAAGMKLGLATSCFPAACEAFLARLGMRDRFSAILYTGGTIRDKRFPDIFLAAAARLGTGPGDCVVFEDYREAGSGVRAAGMGLAAVYDNAAAARWDAFKGEADFAVYTLRELIGLE
jgi:HAD superfamily hydrolase (TIGR01509 family)